MINNKCNSALNIQQLYVRLHHFKKERLRDFPPFMYTITVILSYLVRILLLNNSKLDLSYVTQITFQ